MPLNNYRTRLYTLNNYFLRFLTSPYKSVKPSPPEFYAGYYILWQTCNNYIRNINNCMLKTLSRYKLNKTYVYLLIFNEIMYDADTSSSDTMFFFS